MRYTITATSGGIAILNANPLTRSTFTVKAGSGVSSGTFKISSSNSCGTTVVEDYEAYFSPCEPTSGQYALYPNPTADEVEVQQTTAAPAQAERKSPGIRAVRFYDGYGRLRQEQAGHGASRLRLRTAALPAGLYMVHVLQGEEVVSRLRLQVAR